VQGVLARGHIQEALRLVASHRGRHGSWDDLHAAVVGIFHQALNFTKKIHEIPVRRPSNQFFWNFVKFDENFTKWRCAWHHMFVVCLYELAGHTPTAARRRLVLDDDDDGDDTQSFPCP